MPQHHLKVVAGPAEGTTIPLGAGPLLIGRAATGDGTLGGDPELSRQHARIAAGDSGVTIEDLGSTNGTWVNGRRIEGLAQLGPGDSVVVGTSMIELQGAPDVVMATAGSPADTGATAARPAATPPAPPPSAWLRVVAGPISGMTIPVGDEPFTIGRAAEGHGTLGDDPQLSRQHARLTRSDGRFVIEDLGSTNGTFVNGRRIPAPTLVEPGDAIWVGTTTVVITTPAQPVPDVPSVQPPAPSGESGLLSRFAELSDRHPRRILAGVGVFFVIAGAFGGPVAGLLEQNEGGFDDPAVESVQTADRIAAASGEEAGAQLIVLVRGDQPVTSSATRERVERLQAEIMQEDVVRRTATFYDTGSRSFVSEDGRSTYIAGFLGDVSELEGEEAAQRIDEELSEPPEVLVGGGALAGAQLGETVAGDLAKAEAIAFPLLFALSLFVFRGVVAALLPLFVGMLTILTTFFFLRIINEFVEISQFALNIVIGLGLGLAIDYTLFIVSRYREELARIGKGRPPSKIYGAVPRGQARFAGTESEALRRAIYTAGRTVLYSAVTVAIALAALITFPQPFLYSMGIGGAVTALAAVSVSLLALPALLAILGPRINSLAPARWQRAAQRTAAQEQAGPWYRLSRWVMRRPATVAAVSATFLIVVGLPALGLQFTGVDSSSIPKDLSSRQVADALATDFAVNVSDITVLAEAPATAKAEVENLAQQLRALPGANAAAVQPPRPLEGDLWELTITPTRRALDERTIDLVKTIRDRAAPFDLSVTGETAAFIDQRESIASNLPLALGILISVTLIVLFLMTGSVVLPLKSLLMNALSLGAAFGLLVLIFQNGNLEGVLGFESQGALEISQPVLLFAIAFGLATDYAVFLLTRIKEARTAGHSETDSVAIGLERTGRIVTQAAVLFCIAIGAFATSSVIFIKEVGVGTALAVIIDATIIRAFLVPSLMALLGARNWWAPRPLRRLHNKIGLSES